MTKIMKAAVEYTFNRPLVIEEVAIPEINLNQIVVQITASGVSHTDLHAISGDWPVKPTLPFIPGHEGAGTVVAVGSNINTLVYKGIKETDTKPGG